MFFFCLGSTYAFWYLIIWYVGSLNRCKQSTSGRGHSHEWMRKSCSSLMISWSFLLIVFFLFHETIPALQTYYDTSMQHAFLFLLLFMYFSFCFMFNFNPCLNYLFIGMNWVRHFKKKKKLRFTIWICEHIVIAMHPIWHKLCENAFTLPRR